MKNEEIKKLLKNAVEHKRVVNGYMFLGTKRTKSYKYAVEFAKMILCMNEKISDNCICKSCLMFEDKNHSDYYEINKDEIESIKIEEIRQMQEKVLEKPITSIKKVYIINNAENMTKEAQNCLLKTLEEPPEFVCIILVVNNENKVLNTIKSRCAKISFTEEIVEDFTEEEKEKYKILEGIFGNIENYRSVDLLNKIDVLYKDKEGALKNLDFINMILIKKAKESIKYLDYIDYVEESKERIKSNCNFDMCIDYLILKIWE